MTATPPKYPKALVPIGLAAFLLALSGLRPEDRPARLAPRTVDVARDSWYVMAALEGGSPRLGRRIEAYRALIGPLVPPERLRRVPGIGPRRLERWSPWLREIPAPHERPDSR